MKTISEVEPRTLIYATNIPGDADSVFEIIQAGSYYLFGVAFDHGIEIDADRVTIDLKGLAIIGDQSSLSASTIRRSSWSSAASGSTTASGAMEPARWQIS